MDCLTNFHRGFYLDVFARIKIGHELINTEGQFDLILKSVTGSVIY